jgi:predicted alpha/beta hydrolase
VVAPLAVPLFGYLPGWVRGRGANTPPGIARDTMRFSRSPHFFCDAAGRPLRPFNDRLRAPLRLVTFSDDRIVPPGAEIDLDSYYPQAISRADRLTPEQLGVKAVDHFGFFRKQMPRTAWADAADWLAAHATA